MMNRININYLRQLHYKFAPLMIFPLLLTVITGTLFQVAVVTGNANNFIWLLELHRGKFGRINLEIIYPFLNGFGLLMLGVTGVIMWLQIRPRH
uniref:PepSY domain-containing protein n=2 Tax=Cyanothece sp. BG0011 TaxID=2082950 RepID=UPI001E5C16EC|nr:PepSY domain-containing protein [Cyanothece sp. BG0011]